MSQPSNDPASDEPQPLNEQELAVEIHRYFDLKLDREAYIKPSKDVVIEIYTRFLDATGLDWKRQDGPEVSLTWLMLRWLRFIFSRYSMDFNMGDICMPNRKRTTAFLNVIIYIRALTDKLREEVQHWETQQAEEKNEVDQVKQEIKKVNQAIEELAIEKSSKQSVGEYRASIKDLNEILEKKQVECERFVQKGAKIKEAIEQEKEKKKKEEAALEEINTKFDSLIQGRDLKLKEEALIERLKEAERNLEKYKLQSSLDLGRAQNELTRKGDIKKAHIQEVRARIKKLDTELENISEEISKLTDRRKKSSEQFADCMEQAKRKLDAVKTLYENGMQETKKCEKILTDYKIKRATLIGQPTKKMLTADVNRTFIKSSNNAQ